MSNFYIKVIPNAKKSLIRKEQDRLKVYVTKPAIDGRANESMLELLCEYFCCKPYQIKIVKGEKSQNKIIEIVS